eukprot:6365682-Ditylum_brightwellii.AAC.1
MMTQIILQMREKNHPRYPLHKWKGNVTVVENPGTSHLNAVRGILYQEMNGPSTRLNSCNKEALQLIMIRGNNNNNQVRQTQNNMLVGQVSIAPLHKCIT